MGLVDFVLGEAQPSPNTKLTTHIFPYPTPRRLHVTDLSYPYRQSYKKTRIVVVRLNNKLNLFFSLYYLCVGQIVLYPSPHPPPGTSLFWGMSRPILSLFRLVKKSNFMPFLAKKGIKTQCPALFSLKFSLSRPLTSHPSKPQTPGMDGGMDKEQFDRHIIGEVKIYTVIPIYCVRIFNLNVKGRIRRSDTEKYSASF